MKAEDTARERLSAALEKKWDDTARRVANGKGGWIMRAAIKVLAEQIEEHDRLKARYGALIANQAASRDRLQRMLLTEAEEVERLRALLNLRKNGT
ncbi:hypothetical protein [Asticcacaulis sp.]|uniref:hypothetical protein n=1 Tax=Asticcacaulis sp. TaxID=1872648 RepID=UPI0031E04AD1